MAKIMIVGANPFFEKLKEMGWKYKEHEQTAKQGRMLEGYGWKRYNLVDGKIMEDPNGIWAKNPNEEVEEDNTVPKLNKFEPYKQHCKGSGSVFEQNDVFFNGKGEVLEKFSLKDW